MATVVFVLGKPLTKSPVLPEVVELLRSHGHEVHDRAPRSAEEAAAEHGALMAAADLIVVRGLSSPILRTLEPWASSCVNHPASTRLVTDRHWLDRRLADAGIPVPPSEHADVWPEVLAAPGDVVVKAADGRVGRSAGVLLPGAPRPRVPPFGGPWLVQQAIPETGWEAKCYVAGTEVRVLRRALQTHAAPSVGDPVEITPSAALCAVARAAARATDMTVCGVDVLVHPDGSLGVIDVNPFPSATNLDGAAAWIAAHLTRMLASRGRKRRPRGRPAPARMER